MDGYNNDYNKDLYNVDSSNFCKSCYSSKGGRTGCLVALAVGFAVFFAHTVIANFTTPKTATTVIAVIAVIWVTVLILCRKNKKQNKTEHPL
ncbi:MAG: hypothetical protein IKV52_05380 [Oscillospiraceae bacterium]|nr:hypothetical protein [Oscillospiraceae bacterium]